jgi:hypothetical protein
MRERRWEEVDWFRGEKGESDRMVEAYCDARSIHCNWRRRDDDEHGWSSPLLYPHSSDLMKHEHRIVAMMKPLTAVRVTLQCILTASYTIDHRCPSCMIIVSIVSGWHCPTSRYYINNTTPLGDARVSASPPVTASYDYTTVITNDDRQRQNNMMSFRWCVCWYCWYKRVSFVIILIRDVMHIYSSLLVQLYVDNT